MAIEKTITRETIYQNKIFTVEKKSVELENGSIHRRDIVLHNGGASVVAVDSDNYVYLVKQFRSPFECEILEIPRGKLEKGENPLIAAKRELSEETGFTAENFIDLGEMWPTVGYCSEIIYIYLATGLKRGEKHPDEDEFLNTVKIPFDEAYKMCLDGRIKDGKTIIGIMKAKEHLK